MDMLLIVVYRYMHATTMYRSMTVTLILGVHLLPAKKNRTKFKSQLAKVFTRQMALHCMQQISV